MKVVLDTNVIIASFASRGLCHALFELCLDRFKIAANPFLIEGVETNLVKKLKIPRATAKEITEFLKEIALNIEIDAIPQEICEDPDDAKVLALAEISNAEYLITGDKELLKIKEFGIAKILSPRQFWEAVKRKNG